MKHDLASGAWIDVRPVQDLKAKDKMAVSAAVKMLIPFSADGEPDLSGGVSLGGAMQTRALNAVIARAVTAWSFDLPVPVWEFEQVTHEDSIEELPLDDFNEIEDLLAPYLAKLRRRPDPKGTTTSASNGSSRAKAAGSPKG